MNRHDFLKVFAIVTLLISLVTCSSEQATEQPYSQARDDTKLGPRLAATCLYHHSSEDDPIIKPEPGTGHGHDFYGNVSTDQDSTLKSLRAADAECKQDGDKSAWWIPDARWGNDPIQANKLVIYYQVTPGISPEEIQPFPPEFEAISRYAQFSCGDGGLAGFGPRSLRPLRRVGTAGCGGGLLHHEGPLWG